MKKPNILTICQMGHCRSVALLRELHHRGYSAVAIGADSSGDAITVLADWADHIFVAEKRFMDSIPIATIRAKAIDTKIGPDRWTNPHHPELMELCRKIVDQWEAGITIPKVNTNMELLSCICPTYGRVPEYINLLQESVYWFTQQTYPNKELIILNDCPEQRILCNVPNVRVLNVPSRFKTLGEKYNALVEEAKGTIILPWEDDDISLPNRLAQAEEKLREGREYFNPQQSWYEDKGKIHADHKHGVCHNASAFRKDLWKRVGGYDQCIGDQDSKFDLKCKQLGVVAKPLTCQKEWTYIYRWGVSNAHLSGAKDMKAFYNSIQAKPGIAAITPVEYQKYALLIASILNNETCTGKCKESKCERSKAVEGA